jgi:hypothetical protein
MAKTYTDAMSLLLFGELEKTTPLLPITDSFTKIRKIKLAVSFNQSSNLL